MSEVLKERVNSNKIKFIFIISLYLSLCISKSSAQDNQQPFDYSRTIWIVHNIEGKGIVYGQPNYYDPDSNSYFTITYKILMKYVNNLETFPDFTSAKDLIPEHILVLMNDVAEQQLLIGSSWISDGQKIALMDETDFNNLKTILTRRAKIDNAFTKHPINPLLQSLRKGIQDNPEEFEYRLQLYKDANAKELLDSRKFSFSSSSSQASLTEIESIVSSRSSNTLSSRTSEDPTASNSESVTQPSSKEIATSSTDEDDNLNLILKTATILLALLAGVWLIKRGKK